MLNIFEDECCLIFHIDIYLMKNVVTIAYYVIINIDTLYLRVLLAYIVVLYF